LKVWGELYYWTGVQRRGKSNQSPSSKFIAFGMGKDSWWMFIGQEMSLCSQIPFFLASMREIPRFTASSFILDRDLFTLSAHEEIKVTK